MKSLRSAALRIELVATIRCYKVRLWAAGRQRGNPSSQRGSSRPGAAFSACRPGRSPPSDRTTRTHSQPWSRGPRDCQAACIRAICRVRAPFWRCASDAHADGHSGRRLVQDFYSTVLERENEVRLRRPPLDDEVAENLGAYYAEVAATARKALASNRFREAMFVTEIMLKKQDIDCASLTIEDWQHARQAVLRAGVDIAEALQARYAGDFNYEPRDKLLRQVLDPARYRRRLSLPHRRHQ